jgi:hypothetical protein
MGTVLSSMRDIEEWQVVVSKRNDDPLELDELEVKLAPRKDADVARLQREIASEFLRATEVAPNKITLCSLDEMIEALGMESTLKEKRLVDRRPK